MNVRFAISLLRDLSGMPPLWMCTIWSIFFWSHASTLLCVTFCLASVKRIQKTMASSLAGSNRRMMVRSFSKLFWNGVLDRIISFFGTSSCQGGGRARPSLHGCVGRQVLQYLAVSLGISPELWSCDGSFSLGVHRPRLRNRESTSSLIGRDV